MDDQQDPVEHVRTVLMAFLSQPGTRDALVWLISLAEETQAFTWPQAFWFNLLEIPISDTPRQSSESDEQYVLRTIKYLLSKESPRTSAALGEIFNDFEGEHLDNITIEEALKSVLSKPRRKL